MAKVGYVVHRKLNPTLDSTLHKVYIIDEDKLKEEGIEDTFNYVLDISRADVEKFKKLLPEFKSASFNLIKLNSDSLVFVN